MQGTGFEVAGQVGCDVRRNPCAFFLSSLSPAYINLIQPTRGSDKLSHQTTLGYIVIVRNTFRLTDTAPMWQAESLNEGLRPFPAGLPTRL
jgi:hypothetical protein